MIPGLPKLHGAHARDFAADTEPGGGRAVTAGVVNLGANQEQAARHIAHTRWTHRFDFSMTETDYSVPTNTGVQNLEVIWPINYICLSGSFRGNDVYCSLGNRVRFISYGGIFYPETDFIIRSGVGTVSYRFPTRDNWLISIFTRPATLSGVNPDSPYLDGCKIIFGYLPDETEGIVAG